MSRWKQMGAAMYIEFDHMLSLGPAGVKKAEDDIIVALHKAADRAKLVDRTVEKSFNVAERRLEIVMRAWKKRPWWRFWP